MLFVAPTAADCAVAAPVGTYPAMPLLVDATELVPMATPCMMLAVARKPTATASSASDVAPGPTDVELTPCALEL
ncbi:hypothetical protein D3C71_1611480 [compost metagenome]